MGAAPSSQKREKMNRKSDSLSESVGSIGASPASALAHALTPNHPRTDGRYEYEYEYEDEGEGDEDDNVVFTTERTTKLPEAPTKGSIYPSWASLFPRSSEFRRKCAYDVSTALLRENNWELSSKENDHWNYGLSRGVWDVRSGGRCIFGALSKCVVVKGGGDVPALTPRSCRTTPGTT